MGEMGNRRSVATISAPEFINITSISPFASKCEIKVLYLGQNRNGSAISKSVAAQMAQTLPGCPIVGYYSENKEDFRDHGDQMIIDGDGIKFKCQTTPYGFVAPDAKVWFKDFEDTDEFGNAVVRTYLMTEGYLWTHQYEEAQKVINEGRPQSMELDPDSMKGHWSTDNNRGIDFFIINDAIFSKLCILGEDVEPCFEGSAVTAPDVSKNFSLDEKFVKTLDSMMKELKELTFSLKGQGGNSMANFEVQLDAAPSEPIVAAAPEVAAPAPEVETPAPEAEAPAPAAEDEKNLETEDKTGLEETDKNQDITEEFAKKEDDKEDKKEEEDPKDDSSSTEDETGEDEDEKKKGTKNSLDTSEPSLDEKYSLLETEYKELQDKFTALEAENKELLQFKNNVEDKEKDALIATFYMLSDEDKKDVIENKSKYSLDDIESKLSVICVRKKVNFNLENEEKHEEEIPTVFNLASTEADTLPAWLKAVEDHKNAE